MRTFFLISTLVATTLALPAQTPGQGQPSIGAQRLAGPRTGPAPRLPDGTVDLSGVWVGGGPINDIEREGGLKPGELDCADAPLGEGAHGHQGRHDGAAQPLSPDGRAAHDPVSVSNRADAARTRRATHIFILQEGNIHSYRQVFMDGRKHPPDLDPDLVRHSIGWWEKDTLVIDTVGYNDKFWFDRRGTPHTEQLHTIERWTRMDLGRHGEQGHHRRPRRLHASPSR